MEVDKKSVVEDNEVVVVNSTTNPNDSLPTVRLHLWREAKQWYERCNAFNIAFGLTKRKTMREAYQDVVRDNQRYYSQWGELLYKETDWSS